MYNLVATSNLNSLLPLSQSAHKPIFNLEYSDGVVGAHFAKVDEFKGTIEIIAMHLLRNVGELS